MAFPWREGNRFHLLIDGEHFFPAMLAAIKQSRDMVGLEMYLVQSGRIVDEFTEACCAAAQRGVQVFMLLDAFGAAGLSAQARARLRQSGVQLDFYNPLKLSQLWRFLRRDHRKILVVDHDVAFVGGVGLTDDFDSAVRGCGAWRETVVECHGPVVVDWWRAFSSVWEAQNKQRINVAAAEEVPPRGDQRGRVALSAADLPHEIRRAAIKRIRTAKHRVWMATAYFIPPWKVRRALRKVARKSVEVRILVPGPQSDHPAVHYAGRRYYGPLLRAGVRIFEYQPRFIHAKTMICDDWVSIGSANIDRWNLRWNLEANQEIEDVAFTAEVVMQFERDLAASTEITPARWKRRGTSARILERFWGTVDRLVDRYLRRPGG